MIAPYVIYEGTIFLRKVPGGYELLPSYDGSYKIGLPPQETIKACLKDAGKPFKGKKDRFCLITFDGENYQAYEGWGILAGNLTDRERSYEATKFLLTRDRVEAVAFVDDEGNIEYMDRSEIEHEQTRADEEV